MRRACVVVAFLAVVGLLCMDASFSAAQNEGPVKIGFLCPVSGPFIQSGRDMTDGFRLALEEAGYQVAGRKIEFQVEDDEGVPATTLTKARKLIEKDGAHVIGGILLSSEGYAVAPYISSNRSPWS